MFYATFWVGFSTSVFMPTSVTESIPAHIIEHPALPAAKASARKKPKTKTVPITPETPMDTSTNLKRRRNSGEGASEKMCSRPSYPEGPLEGPSNAFPQRQPLPQTPLQPPLPSPPPPPPPPPQYHIPQHVPSKQQSPLLPQPPQPQQVEPPQPHHKLFHHFPQPPKICPHKISHKARSQSLERDSPKNLPGLYPYHLSVCPPLRNCFLQSLNQRHQIILHLHQS